MERDSPSPALGATSLRRWVRWSLISCFSRTQLSRKPWKWESAWQNQGRKIQKALAQILLLENGGFIQPGFYPTHLEKLLHVLEKGTAATLILHFPETLGAPELLCSRKY